MTQSDESVVRSLSKLLANSYLVYTKTQNYHWNVTGPMFTTLHTLFEVQYTELATAVDEIAERIRALGAHAPGSLAEFAELADVEEETGSRKATEMIRILADDQRRIVNAARQVIEDAEQVGDQASADLGVRRTDVHDKNAWMLESHLE